MIWVFDLYCKTEITSDADKSFLYASRPTHLVKFFAKPLSEVVDLVLPNIAVVVTRYNLESSVSITKYVCYKFYKYNCKYLCDEQYCWACYQ